MNFNLLTITYPFTAIISFLHRLSGLIIFFFTPFLLWALAISLQSAAGFKHLRYLCNISYFKCIAWFFLVSFFYHLIAGIRHMLMDIGFGESLAGGRRSGKIALSITIAFAIGLGIWIH